jgi:hypothetical protein
MLDRTRRPPQQPRHPQEEYQRRYPLIKWDLLTPKQAAMVCYFSDALDDIRRDEIELFYAALGRRES